MTRRLLASYLTLTLVVVLVLEVPLGLAFARRERDRLTSQVEHDAVVLATFAEEGLEQGSAVSGTVFQRYARQTGGRVVVVREDGIAVVDTDPPAPGVRSFAGRPEIATALTGRTAAGSRHSSTLGSDLLYVAVPVASSGVVHGAVRLTYPTSAVDRRIHRYWWALTGLGVTSLVAAAILGEALSRSVTRPLRRLKEATTAFGMGDLAVRARLDSGPNEVREVAATFDDMADRLAELLVAQDAFVADASHQLRTPLAALRLRLENLGATADQFEAGEVDAALAEVSRLSRVIDGLLALARAERATGEPPAERLDLLALAAARAEAWAPLAEERAIEISCTGAPAEVAATPDRVAQVVDNLLANALDASPDGSVIRLVVQRTGAGAELLITDQGSGMSDQERAQAFDRFWRGADAASDGFGGSGLGLPIARTLARADGGDVELEDARGGGVVARLRLRAPAR
ncbi:MAG: HAMP domain-containing protein [Acidobacteria bacterium]|nr:HAMP domain-containing protein [Acidobacteriota bacterium]